MQNKRTNSVCQSVKIVKRAAAIVFAEFVGHYGELEIQFAESSRPLCVHGPEILVQFAQLFCGLVLERVFVDKREYTLCADRTRLGRKRLNSGFYKVENKACFNGEKFLFFLRRVIVKADFGI